MIARVLAKVGEMVRARGVVYKAVELLVLLYVSEIWLVTGNMPKVL